MSLRHGPVEARLVARRQAHQQVGEPEQGHRPVPCASPASPPRPVPGAAGTGDGGARAAAATRARTAWASGGGRRPAPEALWPTPGKRARADARHSDACRATVTSPDPTAATRALTNPTSPRIALEAAPRGSEELASLAQVAAVASRIGKARWGARPDAKKGAVGSIKRAPPAEP